MTRIALVGDIHGNARALRAALAAVRVAAFDELVFMGDLLTYGHDVEEVLTVVSDAQVTHGATLLVGNHDQMYFDIARGDCLYLDRLPAWIADSVRLTLTLLKGARLETRLRWSRERQVAGVLLAHANPFPFGDWTYVEDDATRARARTALSERGLRAGVFGHTHRPRWNDESASSKQYRWTAPAPPLLVNVGAVGQPRDRAGLGWVVLLSCTDEAIDAEFLRIDYDAEAHIAAVRATPLPEPTLARLTAFFTEASQRNGEA